MSNEILSSSRNGAYLSLTTSMWFYEFINSMYLDYKIPFVIVSVLIVLCPIPDIIRASQDNYEFIKSFKISQTFRSSLGVLTLLLSLLMMYCEYACWVLFVCQLVLWIPLACVWKSEEPVGSKPVIFRILESKKIRCDLSTRMWLQYLVAGLTNIFLGLIIFFVTFLSLYPMDQANYNKLRDGLAWDICMYA